LRRPAAGGGQLRGDLSGPAARFDDLYDRVGQRPDRSDERGVRRRDARVARSAAKGLLGTGGGAAQPAAAHRAGDEL
jgi:hypothetical protein